MEEDFINIKTGPTSSTSHSKKKNKKFSASTGTSELLSRSNQESDKIGALIKLLREMKILLAKAVTKVDKVEQSRNAIEYVLLKDDNNCDFFDTTLEDLLACEESHGKKRVRAEDIEEEVRMIHTSIPKAATTSALLVKGLLQTQQKKGQISI